MLHRSEKPYVLSKEERVDLKAALRVAVCLLTMSLGLGLARGRDSGLPPGSWEYREQSRPKGDFREQVYAHIALYKIEPTEEGKCRAAREFGALFWPTNGDEQRAIEDEMIGIMSDLLDQNTRDGDVKCISREIAEIFMTMGPRAIAAVPALERALKAAELVRSQQVNPSECAGFDFGFEGRLDYVLRRALVNIDGQERAPQYVLKCPKDGVPPD